MKLTINAGKIKKLQAEKTEVKKHTILIVDDEIANLESLTVILEQEYNVIKAIGGMEALSIIKKTINSLQINLIISDQRMSGINGVEFLKQTIPLMPKTVRILLTGFTDINDVIASINEGQIYKFLIKPIEPNDLLVSVKRALRSYELEMQNIRLIEELKQVNENLEKIVGERTVQLQESFANLQKQNEELEYLNAFKDKLVAELQLLSYIDPLTGIANRRKLEEFVAIEWGRAERAEKAIAVIMMDIDNFKLYNDTYGHMMGDQCLKKIAQIIKDTLKRPADLAVRYGGEEFCCVLPETDLPGAIKVAEAMLHSIRAEAIIHEKSEIYAFVTLSFGVAATIPNDSISWKELLQKADKYLYQAKNKGKNRVWSELGEVE